MTAEQQPTTDPTRNMRVDVQCVISGDTGTVHLLGPPEAVAAVELAVTGAIAERDEARALCEQYRAWALDGATEMPDDLTFPWENRDA